MCRFLVFKGSEPILLAKLISNPSHSILNQSYDSRLRLDTRRPHNGDGFGIGYYTDLELGPEPCIFTSTIPAWNCINLERLASKTASSLVFAHVRATTEGSLSDDNCHPFSYGTLMWMHNGGLGGWKFIKRRLGEQLLDKWYNNVHGSTDTEWAFALFLNTLALMGNDPSNPPAEGFGPTVLRVALLRTIGKINELIKSIPDQIVQEENVDCRSLLNFAITDGHTVVCSRYVSSKMDEAASLFYSSGTSWDDKTDGNYHMDRKDKGADVVVVASEPLSFERDNWVTVPTNSTITIHKQTVMIHPILDEYYNPSPDFKRSSTLVISKGLDTNEKSITPKGANHFPHPVIPSPNTSNGTVFSEMNYRTTIRYKTPTNQLSPVKAIPGDEDEDGDVFKDKEGRSGEEFILHRRSSMVGNRFRSPTHTGPSINKVDIDLYTKPGFIRSREDVGSSKTKTEHEANRGRADTVSSVPSLTFTGNSLVESILDWIPTPVQRRRRRCSSVHIRSDNDDDGDELASTPLLAGDIPDEARSETASEFDDAHSQHSR